MGRNSAVDRVRESGVLFVIGLDDGGRMNAGGGAESVTADYGIVGRDGGMGGFGNLFAIFLQPGKILLDKAHQAQIDEHKLHWGVADAFAEGIGGSVDGVCSGGYGPEGVGDGEATIVVTMPVNTNFFAAGLHD